MFRVGYGTYLTYPFALIGTLVSIYYLMIENVPMLKMVFPSFTRFTIAAVLVGLPLGIGVGYMHYKRSRAYASEQDISVEANPWNWRAVYGKELMLNIPSTILGLNGTIVGIEATLALLKATGALTPELEKSYRDLRRKFERLRMAYEALRTGEDMRKNPEPYKLPW